MKKISACKAKHCFHDNKEFLPDDDVVKVKNQTYHRDCYQAISDIREVIDLFVKEINPNVVFSELRRVINNIVYTKHISSGMLLYGLKYYIDRRIPLNYPQGLYYVVQNKEVQNNYNKFIANEKIKNYTFTAPVDESQPFTYKTNAPKSFVDVLSGDK